MRHLRAKFKLIYLEDYLSKPKDTKDFPDGQVVFSLIPIGFVAIPPTFFILKRQTCEKIDFCIFGHFSLKFDMIVLKDYKR
jgi:hypothetical protein